MHCTAVVLAAALVVTITATAQPVTQPFNFSLVTTNLPPIEHGGASWGDVDRDGDLDVLLFGLDDDGPVAALYRNDGKSVVSGDTTFIFTRTAELEPLAYSAADWGDFDGDGDLDLVIQGSRTTDPPYEAVTALYMNENNTLSRVESAALAGLHSGAVHWFDVDNDGDLDLVVSGEDPERERLTHVYQNTAGSFSEVESGLPGFAYGDITFGDVDGDGDLDAALSGVGDDGLVSGIYVNDDGTFTRSGVDIAPVSFASLDFGDFDDDGDPDLLVTGGGTTPLLLESKISLYLNNLGPSGGAVGSGAFSIADDGFDPAMAGSASWGDFDNDGDLDLLLLGAESAFGRRVARIYENRGAEGFRLMTYLVGAIFSSADWGDADGDGDLDLVTTGVSFLGSSISNVYENRRQVVPDLPAPPSQLRADVSGDGVSLSWGAIAAQTFNLRVGTRPGVSDVMPAQAETTSGRRLLARSGNAGSNEAWRLSGLPPGKYFWSVQALDAAFRGSDFSLEGLFIVNGLATSTEQKEELPSVFRAYPSFPNPFSSVTTIQIDVPTDEHLTADVFDALGLHIARLSDGAVVAGRHEIQWDGLNAFGARAASGVYFVRVEMGELLENETVTLVR